MAIPHRAHAQPRPADSTAEAVQKEIEDLHAVLMDRAAGAPDRERAAARLLSRGRAETDAILLSVLRDGSNREGQMAVARALAAAGSANTDFIGPLADLIGDRDMTAPAAQALASYKTSDAARQILTRFATQGHQPAAVRTAVILALGKLLDKRAAATLMDLLENDANALVRDAAADALVEMTGLTRYGRDPQQWSRWWRANRLKPDVLWYYDLLNRNATRASELDKRLAQLREHLMKILREDYQRLAAEDRPRRLTAWLSAGSEDLRLVAVQMVYDEVSVGRPVAPAVFESLRAMVGDTSPEVRIAVARTLGAANDPGAVDSLLKQLAQENEADVRREIVAALGPTKDLRTVEPLLQRLGDESFAVARAAADALREKAETLRDRENESLAAQVAAALLERFRGTSNNAALLPLRQSLAECMARLAHPSHLTVFYGLIGSDRETVAVRRAALRGLGLIGNPDSANMIVTALADSDRTVRLDALNALRTTASWSYANVIGERLSPSVESDPAVRDRAWEVLSSLLEKAPPRDLAQWADRFGRPEGGIADQQRRLAVLQVLEKKLSAAEEPRRLAAARQSMGETLLRLGKADEAAAKFREALDYWESTGAGPSVTDYLSQQFMEATLAARRYADAAAFAKDAIQRNSGNAAVLWPKVRERIESLKTANDFDGALALIDEAKKIPFGEIYSSQLPALEEQVRDLKKKHVPGGRTWVRQVNPFEHASLRQAMRT